MARKNWKRFKHTGSIRDYGEEFSTLMLEVQDTPEKDWFFNFMEGLENWDEKELERRGVKDLAPEMAAAEKLIDLKNKVRQVQG